MWIQVSLLYQTKTTHHNRPVNSAKTIQMNSRQQLLILFILLSMCHVACHTLCLFSGPAYLLCGPAADHGLLLLGAAGWYNGSAGVRGRCAAGGGVSHNPGHITRHDRRAHCWPDSKAALCVCVCVCVCVGWKLAPTKCGWICVLAGELNQFTSHCGGFNPFRTENSEQEN